MPEEIKPGEELDLLTPEQEKQIEKVFLKALRKHEETRREEEAKSRAEDEEKRKAQEAADRGADAASKPKIRKRGLFYSKS